MIDGLLLERNKRDRIIENVIIKREKRSFNGFSFFKGDDGNFTIFKFLYSLR